MVKQVHSFLLRFDASLQKGRLCSSLKSTLLHSFTDSFSRWLSPANTVTVGGVTSAEPSPILSHTCAHKSVCVCVFVLWLWQTLDLTTQSLGAHVNMTQKVSEGTYQNRNKQFKPKLNPHRPMMDSLGTLSCSVKCFVILSEILMLKYYNQIKSNHFYSHITTAHVPWWVKFSRACSRQCRNNLHIDSTYLQTYRQCAEYTYIYCVYGVYVYVYVYTYIYSVHTVYY